MRDQNAILEGQNSQISGQLAESNNALSHSQKGYSLLNMSYSKLQENYDHQYKLYKDLQKELWILYSSYNAALAGSGEIGQELAYLKMVSLDSLAHDFYETLRVEENLQSSTWQKSVERMASISMYDRGAMQWGHLDEMYHSHRSAYRYNEATETLGYVLDFARVAYTDAPVEKVGKILAFLNEKLVYRCDLVDRYFSPTETLSSGTGDCDDYSILVSSLLELAGIKSAIAVFTDPGGSGHAMVLVKLPNLDGYGHYHYSDLTGHGLSSGNWIVIEPQTTIENQNDGSWFGKWKIEAAAET